MANSGNSSPPLATLLPSFSISLSKPDDLERLVGHLYPNVNQMHAALVFDCLHWNWDCGYTLTILVGSNTVKAVEAKSSSAEGVMK